MFERAGKTPANVWRHLNTDELVKETNDQYVRFSSNSVFMSGAGQSTCHRWNKKHSPIASRMRHYRATRLQQASRRDYDKKNEQT